MGLLQEQPVLLATDLSLSPTLGTGCFVLFLGDISIISKGLKFVSGLERLQHCDLKILGSVRLPRAMVCGG